MTLTIKIDIDNDAFLYDGELVTMLSRIGQLAQNIDGATMEQPIHDSNGNTVGNWSIHS